MTVARKIVVSFHKRDETHCLLRAAFHANPSEGCQAECGHLSGNHSSQLDVRAVLPSCFCPFSNTHALFLFFAMPFKIHHTLTLLYFSVSLLVAANPPSKPFPPESSHKCYFIDGSYDPAGGPCYGNVGASMCCYTGKGCLFGSGLCLARPNGPVGPDDNGSSIWRRSCTDLTWQDPACLAIAYGRAYLSLRACILKNVARPVANSVIRS